MCARYVGYALLAWLPGLLHAQRAKLPCSPPELAHGYIVPQQKTYADGKTLTYGCETEFKPVVEGWWATSTCQNGKWSHTPQCIGNRSCLPPTIPNGKYEEAQKGWFKENSIITVTCEDGFDLEQPSNTAHCTDGRWSLLPICKKSAYACNEPDKIPRGVIISQEPKEVYAANSQLEYVCEDGYTTGDPNNRKTIICRSGTWTPKPSCTPTCVLDPTGLDLIETSPIKLNEGESKVFNCKWDRYWMYVRCSNRRIEKTYCCSDSDIAQRRCLYMPIR